MEYPDYGIVRRYDRTKAVRVYTVCDESRYLIVRNVPALGCTDELLRLFGLYGRIEDHRMLDEEDCEPFTDVHWIKYAQISNARFSKRKLDEYKFLGNLLKVTYSPESETAEDTKDKLEERRRTVLHRIRLNSAEGGHLGLRHQAPTQPAQHQEGPQDPLLAHVTSTSAEVQYFTSPCQHPSASNVVPPKFVGGLQPPHFPTSRQPLLATSVDTTVLTVRQKLDAISNVGDMARRGEQGPKTLQSSGVSNSARSPPSTPHRSGSIFPAAKRRREDNRRRI